MRRRSLHFTPRTPPPGRPTSVHGPPWSGTPPGPPACYSPSSTRAAQSTGGEKWALALTTPPGFMVTVKVSAASHTLIFVNMKPLKLEKRK